MASLVQQVNLYQPIFRKQKKLFSAIALLQISGVIAIGLLLIAAYGYWQKASLDSSLARLRADEAAKAVRVAALDKQYPQRPESRQMERRAAQLAAEVVSKQAVLNKLKGMDLGKTAGFSAYLDGLARQKVQDLWLAEIHVREGGAEMLLKGSALDPVLVPRYLQRLSGEVVFDGKLFRTLLVSRPEEEPRRVDFSVGTAATERQQQ